jgi:hypothetical protein
MRSCTDFRSPWWHQSRTIVVLSWYTIRLCAAQAPYETVAFVV